MIRVKRAYEPPSATDGPRFLIDHLWPRGLKKNEVKIKSWLKTTEELKQKLPKAA